jgi:hypothetical protein
LWRRIERIERGCISAGISEHQRFVGGPHASLVYALLGGIRNEAREGVRVPRGDGEESTPRATRFR